MQALYLEHRNQPENPPATLAADISRHLQMRQYLGTALIICEHPMAMLSATRKQWVKATRRLQKMRASTLNAEEILRLTHVVIHMQNWQFSPKDPAEQPHAGAYFIPADQLNHVPPECFSVYITMSLPMGVRKKLLAKLPDNTTIINYTDENYLEYGLLPKIALEQKAIARWTQLLTYLHKRGIHPERLVAGGTLQFSAMDQALETLLDYHEEFLHRAAGFQHLLSLGQPFTLIPKNDQKMYEAVTRLAHRVQSLTPGSFNGYLTNMFGDISTDDYFLRDACSELYEDLEVAAAISLL